MRGMRENWPIVVLSLLAIAACSESRRSVGYDGGSRDGGGDGGGCSGSFNCLCGEPTCVDGDWTCVGSCQDGGPDCQGQPYDCGWDSGLSACVDGEWVCPFGPHPLSCGTGECAEGQYCIHPCCGGAPPACEARQSDGSCASGYEDQSGFCPAEMPCSYPPCTPPEPYCSDTTEGCYVDVDAFNVACACA